MRETGVPLTSITGLDTAQLSGGAQDIEWGTGGSRLLLQDLTSAFLLLSAARRRLVSRMFGVPVDQTGLITIIALGLLAKALREGAGGALTTPAVPSFGDTAIAGSVVREVGHLIAGEASRDAPLLVPLVAIAVTRTVLRPVLRVSFRDVRVASHRVRVMFDRRYGHLVRRNRPRPASVS